MKNNHGRYILILVAIFAVEWIALAVSPYDRADWLLENVLVLIFIVVITVSYKRFPLSRISYTLIFIFLALHEVGCHYTYAKVPYDEWTQQLFGFSVNTLMGFQRNHYDRMIHFCYGVLLAYPIRELFIRIALVKGFWGYFLPIDLTMSTSLMYELIEWAAAVLLGGELGMAYLGTQGDIWDAHKDMALASLGALIAMVVTAGINVSLQRDFAREWADSIKVKGRQPLGEEEIMRMWRKRNKSEE